MPQVFAVDTSCIVAAVCSWHESHAAAAAALETRLARGERLSVASHALSEAYAVLTRLPAPHRLTPADAWALVSANFVHPGSVASISSREHVALLERLAAAGVAGGRTYDAIIGECARRGGATAILTFNARHFDPPPSGVSVVAL